MRAFPLDMSFNKSIAAFLEDRFLAVFPLPMSGPLPGFPVSAFSSDSSELDANLSRSEIKTVQNPGIPTVFLLDMCLDDLVFGDFADCFDVFTMRMTRFFLAFGCGDGSPPSKGTVAFRWRPISVSWR